MIILICAHTRLALQIGVVIFALIAGSDDVQFFSSQLQANSLDNKNEKSQNSTGLK